MFTKLLIYIFKIMSAATSLCLCVHEKLKYASFYALSLYMWKTFIRKVFVIEEVANENL